MNDSITGSQPLAAAAIKAEGQLLLTSSRLPFFIICGLFVYYLTIFLSYRPYDIDNPWFLSFSYDTCIEHVDNDQFLNARFPAGMDGTQFFGKLAAYTQCGVLSHSGWQQWPAMVLSASLVTLSLALWWLQLSRLGYSPRTKACFLVIAGLSEPFVSAANKARYESFSFTLISLGLLLVAYDYPLLGSLVAGLAIEVEPVAAAGLIPLFVLIYLRKQLNRRSAGKSVIGLGLAMVVYFALHPHIAALVTPGLRRSTSPLFSGGFFNAYFLSRIRHAPELLFFLTAAAVYWKRRRVANSHYLALSGAGLALFSVLMPHGNAAYMIFAYPFFVGTALLAFNSERHPWIIIAVTLLLFLPQQFVLLVLTRNLGLRSADVRTVSEAIDQASRRRELAPSSTRIYGDYRLWFAHPHFFRAAAYGTIEYMRDSDLYLCFDKPPQPLEFEPQYLLYCGDFNRLLPLEPLGVVSIRGDSITIYGKK